MIHSFTESDPDVELQSDNMSRKYHFAIRDEAGALAKALLVFNVCKKKQQPCMHVIII